MKMKLLITITAMLLAAPTFSVNAAGTFQDVLDIPAVKTPLAARTLYNGVALAGERLVTVGQRGHVLYSDDQGKSWVQAAVPVSSDLVAVHFPSPQKGWAVGHDGVVLHTVDAGATWTKQLDGRAAVGILSGYYAAHPPTGPDAVRAMKDIRQTIEAGANKPFLDVWFETDSSGYIVGAFNLIFHTADGGKSWEPLLDRSENVKRLHIYAIRPVGEALYLCGEQGMVLKLERKTGRFRGVATSYKGTLFGVTGKPGAVIAFGLRGNVFRSTDGGAHWQKIETGVSATLTGGTLTDDGRIVLVSQGGEVLVSGDGGASFRPVKVKQPFPATGVVALDNQSLMLAGLRGMKKQPLN